jgi:DNA-directed RNA polymerase subunit beta
MPPPSVLTGVPSVLSSSTPEKLDKPAQPPVTFRNVTDTSATRKLLYDNVLGAINSIGPLQNARHTLTIHDADYADPEDFSIAQEKDALLSGKTLSRRIRGVWRLTDNATGETLDEKPATLAAVPYLTPRGTFIVNGTDYVLSHQPRLRPGVYARIKDNLATESHVNVLAGQGLSHRYLLDPETNLFRINVGQAKIPLMPLLKAMGVPERQMREAWGDQITNANLQANEAGAINKLYTKLVRREQEPPTGTRAEAVANAMRAMKLDPDVTQRTLGARYDTVTPEVILAATKKLIGVSRGEVQPDDRDHMAYQTLMGPEDLMAERVTKDKAFLRQLLWKASFRRNLGGVQPGVFTRQLMTTLLHSGLGQSVEEINPGELLDASTRTTRLGEGGISSIAAIPDESRSVLPSHFGFIDPIRTPESESVGIDTRMAYTARKGSDGRLYSPFMDHRTGQLTYRSAQDVADEPIAFPGEFAKSLPYVRAIDNGQLKYLDRSKVRYELPKMASAFSPLSNLIPMASGIKGQRLSMGARMLTQALPLVNREAPLVQSGLPGQHLVRSFEDEYGTAMGAVRSAAPGVVKSVGRDAIVVQHPDGSEKRYDLYDNFPYARKTSISNTPQVVPGQPVDRNTLLASSNFTDQHGTTALGLNAKVAFLPIRGATYEDGFVVSESFAKKLASEHTYQHAYDWPANIRKGRNAFVSLFPATYSREQIEALDDRGVVRPGQTVRYGDPLVVASAERPTSYSQIHRSRKPTFVNRSITWDHSADGVVTDVSDTKHGVNVVVKATHPTTVSDKISARQGSKGVISQIIPDDQMIRGEDGQPFDIAVNGQSVNSRGNPSQAVELALAKIAMKTGKPYKVEDFGPVKDLVEFAQNELKKHGLKDTETIFDPDTGREIPNVLTGGQYFLKLYHTAESKGQSRGIGPDYSSDEQPAKGTEHASKRLALMETNALLSHGAVNVLRDAKVVRGQKNDDYWLAYMNGFNPPQTRVPLAYRKYIANLQAAGMNPVRDGPRIQLMAMTDKDINHLAGDRELKNADLVDWKGLKPKPGGLFDPALTGGHGGNQWSKITLHEPLPNPVFEEPIRRLLDMTQKEFDGAIAGKHPVGNYGTGPLAVQKALADINLDKGIAAARQAIAGSRKTARDGAVRRLRYLKDAQRLGIHPKDWIISSVPVLPPIFRPVSVMQQTGSPLVSDANVLYKELFDANQAIRELHGRVGDVSQERSQLYAALKGVVGLGDPVQPKNQERGVTGILQSIFGKGSPKFSTMQRQLLSQPVDLVGRAVVSPDPNLDLDEIGLPESKAWEVYKPFIFRRLIRGGMARLAAARSFRDRLPEARRAMLDEMQVRPVIASRAPVLHRYGVMAFWPKLHAGESIKTNIFINKGFGLDHDGDQMNYHVPGSDAARDEAIEKLLPSRNLLSAADFRANYTPNQDYQGGLYHASTAKDEKGRGRIFATKQDAIAAYRRGDLTLADNVRILR